MGCSLAWKSLLYIKIPMATTRTPPSPLGAFLGHANEHLSLPGTFGPVTTAQNLGKAYQWFQIYTIFYKYIFEPPLKVWIPPHAHAHHIGWSFCCLFRTTFWVCQFLLSNWSNWNSSGCIPKARDVATANRLQLPVSTGTFTWDKPIFASKWVPAKDENTYLVMLWKRKDG